MIELPARIKKDMRHLRILYKYTRWVLDDDVRDFYANHFKNIKFKAVELQHYIKGNDPQKTHVKARELYGLMYYCSTNMVSVLDESINELKTEISDLSGDLEDNNAAIDHDVINSMIKSDQNKVNILESQRTNAIAVSHIFKKHGKDPLQ